MTMIGAAISVFTERSAEFRKHNPSRVTPSRTNFFRKTSKALAQFAEAIREIATVGPLVHVSIPAADIDKSEIVLLPHEAANTACGEFEPLRRNSAAARIHHVLGDRLIEVVAHP